MLRPVLVTGMVDPLPTTIDVLTRLLNTVMSLPASEARCEVAPVSKYHAQSSLVSG